MKIVILSLFFLFILPNKGIEDIRISFQKASLNKDNALLFNELMLQSLTIEKDLHAAYLGASEALLAKFGESPGEKLNLFKAGKSNIEKAISNKPKSVEIRLIRLIIQNNAPAIVRYSGEIEEDRAFIIENFSSASADVQNFVLSIAQDTNILTAEELTKSK